MRYLLVLLLSGCTYNALLIPKNGGERAIGNFDGWSAMTVTLRGEEYSGSVQRGTGVSTSPMAGGMPIVTMSNQYGALLVGPQGALRCSFTLDWTAGNGWCDGPDGTMYDLIIRQK